MTEPTTNTKSPPLPDSEECFVSDLEVDDVTLDTDDVTLDTDDVSTHEMDVTSGPDGRQFMSSSEGTLTFHHDLYRSNTNTENIGLTLVCPT